MDDHTMQVDQNLYGFFGECACSNPDGEGTGYVGIWADNELEILDWYGEHLDKFR